MSEELKTYKVETEEGEEVEAIQKSEYEKIKADLDVKNKDIEEISKKLEGLSAKDKNWKELRETKEKIESRLSQVETAFKQTQEERDKTLKDEKEKVLSDLSKGDSDV